VSESDTEKQRDDITGAKIGAATRKAKQAWENGGNIREQRQTSRKGKGMHLEVKHETEKQVWKHREAKREGEWKVF
jgi:hypothetical protein